MKMRLSPLPKTWIFDLDGTLVVHNGYKTGPDTLLPGVADFFEHLSESDAVVILTGREEEARERTVGFLKDNGIRFDAIHFEMPIGERILINDDKPSGLPTAYSVRLRRDEGIGDLTVETDEGL